MLSGGLPTQRECLELLGCYGPGQERKLAEIVAATVLCGEISLGTAVVADEWVEGTSGSAGTGRNPAGNTARISRGSPGMAGSTVLAPIACAPTTIGGRSR